MKSTKLGFQLLHRLGHDIWRGPARVHARKTTPALVRQLGPPRKPAQPAPPHSNILLPPQ